MKQKYFIVEIYKKQLHSYVLRERHVLSTKIAGINQFNEYVEECNLNGEKIEEVDEKGEFIWRIKTETYLLILRKDF